jgi:hypothetical protein
VFSHRFVDFDVKRAKERHTVAYRATPALQVGIEWNPAVNEVGFIGNAILQAETAARPHISVGTSSYRIGTPEGPKCYYVTFAKGFPAQKVAPYVSINYSEHDDGFNFPFGVTIELAPEWRLMPMFDGSRSHLLLTYMRENYSVSLMWVWYKHAGISLSWGF